MAEICLWLLVSSPSGLLPRALESSYFQSELIFQPFRKWFTKGPITPLFHKFVWSAIPLHSKFTISGYIFSYYAIGCAWFLTVMNYFIEGWNSEFFSCSLCKETEG
jgi:hypothetical protein